MIIITTFKQILFKINKNNRGNNFHETMDNTFKISKLRRE